MTLAMASLDHRVYDVPLVCESADEGDFWSKQVPNGKLPWLNPADVVALFSITIGGRAMVGVT